jgi:predicted nucleic acid-binding protein
LTLLVVDAGVATTAALERDGFDRLHRHDLMAPPLMWSEATAALRQLVWRGEIDEDTGQIALVALMDAPIDRRTPRRLHREAFRIATVLGWAKTFDAEYLALARLLDHPLLTIDGRLKRGASRIATVIGPADLD